MSIDKIAKKIEHDRFLQRVKILYYARIFILFGAISILSIPVLQDKFNLHGSFPFVVFALMIIYSTVNYYIKEDRLLHFFTFITLIIDNFILMVIIVNSGGLQSPILTTQIVYLIFFTTLFPKPIYTIPPLIMLPIITRVDLLLGNEATPFENIFTIIWLSALNIIIIYFIVLLESKIHANSLKIYQYQQQLKEKSILEEKNKIARDLHDGVGGALSSLIVQSEYILSMAEQIDDEEIVSEIAELKYYAEESMDEIRRSLNAIKNNFNLESAIQDYIDTFKERNRMAVDISIIEGKIELSAKDQVSFFRIFQELMSNALKHSNTDKIDVKFEIYFDNILLTVIDYGKGFDKEINKPGHFGLKNLKERVELLKGDINIDSKIDQGTTITIKIPNHVEITTDNTILWHN